MAIELPGSTIVAISLAVTGRGGGFSGALGGAGGGGSKSGLRNGFVQYG